jgi:carboxypeptidase family protein/TonB-dependent receptor-like protein
VGTWRGLCLFILLFLAMRPPSGLAAIAQQAGSIRGNVTDKDFDVALAAAEVAIVETGQKTLTTDQGNYSFGEVPPGRYTLVFTKSGYARQVRADVVVVPGQLTDCDAALAGEFTEMEEFVVQDMLAFGAGSEAALLRMRFEAPALMDSIGADLMSRAGASDAAGALRLVSGASVQGDKYAVIRGLPDRYVSSQLNGVRMPSSDQDKRAVELDQFPAAVIESVQVSKTFTPDQQGDASGGAVNLKLKGIPDEWVASFKVSTSWFTNWSGIDDFRTYDGGGVSYWGRDDGGRDKQLDKLGQSWSGAAGTTTGDAPLPAKWSAALGGKEEIGTSVKVGGYASLFHEEDGSFFDDGKYDLRWVENPGEKMTPQYFQGTPTQGSFNTGLYDVTQGTQSVKWGALATLGIEAENHKIGFTTLYTRHAEDVSTLAIDTRGKEYYFPGYDPNNPQGPGNEPSNLLAAPYNRLETLQYTERTTTTFQLDGQHKLHFGDFGIDDFLKFKPAELDWTVSHNSALMNQPDKRQFSAIWEAASYNPGAPPFIDPFITPPLWLQYKPAALFALGNFQRIWETIDEESRQYSADLKFPFEQWSEEPGYLKFGLFDDHVVRSFNQDTFSNFNDNSNFPADFDQPWSSFFPSQSHPITASDYDVDYRGDQTISAYYGMIDLPLNKMVTVIGGVRFESTGIGIVNHPDPLATWFPPGSDVPVKLNPGDADVDFHSHDWLPALALEVKPVDQVTLRGAFSETVARQTFKELTPILQQEYLGGPVFIGNPFLQMSELKNYDLRADWTPVEGSLLSASWFWKSVEGPIEYVQRFAGFDYTTAVNYPRGMLEGYELEARQGLGRFWDPLEGLAVGANGTWIESQVTLSKEDQDQLSDPAIKAPMTHRDMTNAPDHLYNLYATYDFAPTETQFALFYTVQGDALLAGAGVAAGHFVPSVYGKEYDTLNLSVIQKLGKYTKLQFQAKNLTNSKIETVYRSPYIGADVPRSSYTKGIEYSIALLMDFRF